MATIFATGKVDNSQITNLKDKKIQNFNKALNKVLLNLAKRVVSDDEGSSKFITIKVNRCKSVATQFDFTPLCSTFCSQ